MVKTLDELVLVKTETRDYILKEAPELVNLYDDISDQLTSAKLTICLEDGYETFSNKDLVSILKAIDEVGLNKAPKQLN